jgi:hypothetical protein
MNFKPIGNLVSFTWLKPEGNIIAIPDSSFNLNSQYGRTEGIRMGYLYLGKVKTTGKKVKYLKEDDIIMVHEFGIKNYHGVWNENEIYFIEEDQIKSKVILNPNDKIPLINRIIYEWQVKEIEDALVDGGSKSGTMKEARRGRKGAVDKLRR